MAQTLSRPIRSSLSTIPWFVILAVPLLLSSGCQRLESSSESTSTSSAAFVQSAATEYHNLKFRYSLRIPITFSYTEQNGQLYISTRFDRDTFLLVLTAQTRNLDEYINFRRRLLVNEHTPFTESKTTVMAVPAVTFQDSAATTCSN